MTCDRYVLNAEGEPEPCEDLYAWGAWMQKGNRIVQQDTLPDGVRVSTVFLGLDHSFGLGPPLLWETMIFGGPHDSYQERHSSIDGARRGHETALALSRAA